MPSPELITRLTVDRRGLADGLKQAQNEVRLAAGGISKEFSAITSPFTSLKATLVGAAGALGLTKVWDLMNEKAGAFQERLLGIRRTTALTGFDAETAQRLGNIFSAVGDSAEGVARPLGNLEEALARVREGGKDAEKTFQALVKLGVSFKDVQQSEAHEVFLKIFTGLKGAAQDAGKLAALKEVFGRGGIQLLPAANVGLDSQAAEGGILTNEELAAMEKLRKEHSGKKAFLRDMKLVGEVAGFEAQASITTPSGLKRLFNKFLNPIIPQEERFDMVMTDKGQADAQRRADARASTEAQRIAQDEAAFRAHQQEIADLKAGAMNDEKAERLRKMQLSPAQRRAELDAEIEALQRRDPEDDPVLRSQLLDLQLERAGLATAKEKERDVPRADQLDSLARIGGLTQFGGFNEELTIQKDIRAATQDAARYLESLSREGIGL